MLFAGMRCEERRLRLSDCMLLGGKHCEGRNQSKFRPGGTQRLPKPLGTNRDLDDLLLDRVLHQLRLVVNIQLAHQIELVCFDCLHAQV